MNREVNKCINEWSRIVEALVLITFCIKYGIVFECNYQIRGGCWGVLVIAVLCTRPEATAFKLRKESTSTGDWNSSWNYVKRDASTSFITNSVPHSSFSRGRMEKQFSLFIRFLIKVIPVVLSSAKNWIPVSSVVDEKKAISCVQFQLQEQYFSPSWDRRPKSITFIQPTNALT